MKIVCAVPSITELLYDLGLAQYLVGRTKFCIHPHNQIDEASVIGGTKNLNIKKIQELNPSIIIANKEENSKDQIELLKQKYEVVLTEIDNFRDAINTIRLIGNRLNCAIEASVLINKIEQEFKALSNINTRNHNAIYFIWNNPMMCAGNNTYINSMLAYAGFNNIIKTDRYPELKESELKMHSPEYVLLSSEPYPFKEKHIKYFEHLLPNAKVLLVDGEMFSWYGSRMLKAPKYFLSLHS